jgi:hypothetical protein
VSVQPLIDMAAGLGSSLMGRIMIAVLFACAILPTDVFVRWCEAIWPALRDFLAARGGAL